jgi:multiple sugar transport system ATP-binding protein
MMASIRMENVSKAFGAGEQYRSVSNLSFEVKEGELFCFIGPTNSGKTEILRLIAGLEKPDSGRIFINGREANEIRPKERGIGMLFESLALYPNKNGFDNIASPLKIKKTPKTQIYARVMEVSKRLKIEHLLDREPETYSGGEKQRVALARVMVQEPNAYLLDEPLSGLDARLRISMRSELKRIQRDLGKTMVFVSHDQEEAMSLGNRIGVLKEGRIEQIGTPQELYNRPANIWVAKTIGKPTMNFYHCILQQENGKLFASHEHFRLEIQDFFENAPRTPQEREIILGIRPENIEIFNAKQGEEDIPAVLFISEPLGAKAIVDFKVGHETVRILAPADEPFEVNEKKWLRMRKDKLHIFNEASKETIF